MSLSIVSITTANPAPCQHLNIVVEKNGVERTVHFTPDSIEALLDEVGELISGLDGLSVSQKADAVVLLLFMFWENKRNGRPQGWIIGRDLETVT